MNAGVSSRGSPTPKSINSRPSAAAWATRRSSSSRGYGATLRIPGERWVSVISLVSSGRSPERTARSRARAGSTQLERIDHPVEDVAHRALEQHPPVLASLHAERAPAERHGDRGRRQPCLARGDRDGAGSRPARERLPDTALPHADARLTVDDPNELDVGPLGEELVVFERRPDV